jgi:hypothetical protein
VTLPTRGTYTVLVDPAQDTVISAVTVRLWSVPANVTGTIEVGGPVVTASNSTPGQNAAYTFTGTSGQNVWLSLTNVSLAAGSLAATSAVLKVSILKPDSTVLVAPITIGTNGKVVPATLSVMGTYTIVIDRCRTRSRVRI